MEIFSNDYALLSIQGALLDTVTPELRAVAVKVIKDEKTLFVRFYYDGEVSEELIELWSCVVTEASAHLGLHCRVDYAIERLDYPAEIPVRGRLAYLRKEPLKKTSPSESIFQARELVDFKEVIGLFVSPETCEKTETSWGVIHYAKDGCHIIPAKPEKAKIAIFSTAYALLSIQRALLGIVTPELRTVIVDAPEGESLLYVRFYYVGEVSGELLDFWETAISELLADFGIGYSLDSAVESIEPSAKIPFRGRYALIKKQNDN